MQPHFLAAGIILTLVLGGVFLFYATDSEAQSSGGYTILRKETIGSDSISVISTADNILPLLERISKLVGQQAFMFGGADNSNTFIFVRTLDDRTEGIVYARGPGSQTFSKIDCETAWYTFSSTDLDFSSKLGGQPINFAKLLSDSGCQIDDTEGSFEPATWINELKVGENILKEVTPNTTTQGTTTPTANPTPKEAAKASLVLNEACEIGSDTPQYITMASTPPEFMEGGAALNDKIFANDTTEYARTPRNIIFQDEQGKAHYLLQIWHFNNNETIAASIASRINTAGSISWDIVRNLIGQGIDNLTTIQTLGLGGTDIGRPIDAAMGSIDAYNTAHPTTSSEYAASQIANLPGFGKLTLGMRLCAMENGTFKPYWNTVTHSRELIPDEFDSLLTLNLPSVGTTNYHIVPPLYPGTGVSIPGITLTTNPISIPSGAAAYLDYKATFLSGVRGKITVLYQIRQTTTPGSLDTIEAVRIKASEDPSKDIFRFRLTNDTLNVLRKNNHELNDPDNNPETNDRITNDEIINRMTLELVHTNNRTKWLVEPIQQPGADVNATTRDKSFEGLLFNLDTPGTYLTTAAAVSVRDGVTGKPTKLAEYVPIYPGEYQAILKMDGYKEYKFNFSLSTDKLSTNNTLAIQPGDIYQMAIPNFKLENDCTAMCNNLVSCLSCLDEGIATSYRK